jgi:hypothetical protein
LKQNAGEWKKTNLLGFFFWRFQHWATGWSFSLLSSRELICRLGKPLLKLAVFEDVIKFAAGTLRARHIDTTLGLTSMVFAGG